MSTTYTACKYQSAAGTIAKLTANIAVMIGAITTVYPVTYVVSDNVPRSGAVPHVDGPTIGVIVAASLSSTPGAPPYAKVRLMAPGKANDGRIITVLASAVAQ